MKPHTKVVLRLFLSSNLLTLGRIDFDRPRGFSLLSHFLLPLFPYTNKRDFILPSLISPNNKHNAKAYPSNTFSNRLRTGISKKASNYHAVNKCATM